MTNLFKRVTSMRTTGAAIVKFVKKGNRKRRDGYAMKPGSALIGLIPRMIRIEAWRIEIYRNSSDLRYHRLSGGGRQSRIERAVTI